MAVPEIPPGRSLARPGRLDAREGLHVHADLLCSVPAVVLRPAGPRVLRYMATLASFASSRRSSPRGLNLHASEGHPSRMTTFQPRRTLGLRSAGAVGEL